jgi:uncharacterized membrane protein
MMNKYIMASIIVITMMLGFSLVYALSNPTEITNNTNTSKSCGCSSSGSPGSCSSGCECGCQSGATCSCDKSTGSTCSLVA